MTNTSMIYVQKIYGEIHGEWIVEVIAQCVAGDVRMREMVGGCCVCSDERGWDENPLVYCDGVCCSVAVHQACYGIVCVPTGPWFCRKCESQERSARVRCELCPRRDGALKRTDSSSWAHVVCALYIPEVRFGNVSTMEPIVLGLVPPDRYIQSCYLCVKGGRQNRASCGACMQCNRPGCKQSFHVTCAQSQGLLCEEAGNYLDNVKYCGYCEYHYSKINKKVIKTIPAYKPVSSSISSLSPCSSPDKMEIKSCATNTSTFNKKNKKSRCHRSGSVPYTSNISTITLMNSITDNSRASTQLVTLDSTPSSKSSQVFISDLQPANEEIRMSTKEEDSGSEVNEVLSIENSTVFKIDDVGPVSQSTKNDGKLISSEKLEVRDVSNKVINEPNSNDSKISAKQGSEVHLNSVDILKTSPVPSSSTLFTSSPQTCDSSINNPTPSIISSSVVTQFLVKYQLMLNQKKSVIESTDEYAFSQENNAKDLSVRSLYNGVNKRGIVIHLIIKTARSPISSPELESASSLKKKRKRLSNCIKLPTSVSNTGNEKASTVWMMGTSINPTSNVAKEMNENLVGVSVPIKNEKGMSDISSKRYHIQPQSLKDLLERQWEQGSHFIMEQASHFDIASLLSSLNQLKEENVELEHNVDKLIQRRDHLLAVRARLMAISINNVQSSGMCQFSEVGRYNTCQQQQQQQSSYINGPSRNNSTVDSPARATQLSAVGNISTMGNILCSVGGSQEFHKMTRSIENVSSSSSISRTHNIHQSIQHNLTHVRYNTFSFVPPFTATSNGSATVSHQSTNQHHILALDGSTHHLRNNVRTIDKR
ncbi:MLLT6_10 [Lepeophtheirus salmonis]|uniref:MLLT6_10 n=1 Tax=Lepeophtheirus salmonis TaxID=72036 RepID=A0A7R8H1Z2_LEPSM|nr:MLLT6_10 [Lepeophtheirus salmonis]CAF2819977.1 MLLT6_10 [Lepeophtheirus salmonis]